MKAKILVFFLSFTVWFLLVWPVGGHYGGLDYQGLTAGFFASLISALIFGRGFTEKPSRIIDPRRWFYVLVFIPVFVYYCIKANLQVAYLILHPKLPIKPGIVKMRTKLKNRVAIAVLSNCITLTPGTLTVEATEEGVLYVHWLAMTAIDEEEAGRIIAGKFEYFLHKIFEDN